MNMKDKIQELQQQYAELTQQETDAAKKLNSIKASKRKIEKNLKAINIEQKLLKFKNENKQLNNFDKDVFYEWLYNGGVFLHSGIDGFDMIEVLVRGTLQEQHKESILKLLDGRFGELVIDKDFMEKVVKPLVWARLNPDIQLAQQITETANELYRTFKVADSEFFKKLPTKEAKVFFYKLYYEHDIRWYGLQYAVRAIQAEIITSEDMTLDDIRNIMKFTETDGYHMSQGECEDIWSRLKPELIKLFKNKKTDVEVSWAQKFLVSEIKRFLCQEIEGCSKENFKSSCYLYDGHDGMAMHMCITKEFCNYVDYLLAYNKIKSSQRLRDAKIGQRHL